MTIDGRYKYVRLMKKRYTHAARREQDMLLDEMEQVTGMHRKSLIRLLNSAVQHQPHRKQRGRVY